MFCEVKATHSANLAYLRINLRSTSCSDMQNPAVPCVLGSVESAARDVNRGDRALP